MKKPTKKEIDDMKRFLHLSIRELIDKDANIFIKRLQSQDLQGQGTWYRRKLHEITVCHRLAVYFEKNISSLFNSEYSVDLEYNKNHQCLKGYYDENDKFKHVRPDILIHTRTMSGIATHQHLLFVEAKMASVPLKDKKKVLEFMKLAEYSYLFGLTISFWADENAVKSTLYYYNKNRQIVECDVSEPI